MFVVSHEVMEIPQSLVKVFAEDVSHLWMVGSGFEHPNLHLLDGLLVEESQILAIGVVLVQRRLQEGLRWQLELFDRLKGAVNVFVELGVQRVFSDIIWIWIGHQDPIKDYLAGHRDGGGGGVGGGGGGIVVYIRHDDEM